MTNRFKIITILILVSILLVSCSSVSAVRYNEKSQDSVEQNIKEMQTIEKFIKKHYGAKYVSGATGPNSFDCSGFVLAAFQEIYKVQLPRTAMKQYYSGKHISKGELNYGDLVFFNTNGRGISHVGVYIGNDKFGHASTSRGVMISDLNDYYFKNKFVAARRIIK